MNKPPTIPIRVKGHGMIPRIGRLAPLLVPALVELDELEVIVDTQGMSVEYFDDVSRVLIPITGNNYKKVFNAYQQKINPQKTKPVGPKKPVTPPVEPKAIKKPEPTPPVKEPETPPTPPPVDPPKPQIAFAIIIGENDTKISTGVTVEQLASGECKGKSDWWIPQGDDLVPIPAEWIEEGTPTPVDPPSGDSTNENGDLMFKPVGGDRDNNNHNKYGKKNKNK